MTRLFANTVKSVHNPPAMVVLASEEQYGWCQQVDLPKCLQLFPHTDTIFDQFSEEGYNVYHVNYPTPSKADLVEELREVQTRFKVDWALVTYGLQSGDLVMLGLTVPSNLRACIHFCPAIENAQELILRYSSKRHVP